MINRTLAVQRARQNLSSSERIFARHSFARRAHDERSRQEARGARALRFHPVASSPRRSPRARARAASSSRATDSSILTRRSPSSFLASF
eukprot:30414-Pelagococcus_subviridis.AAC.11